MKLYILIIFYNYFKNNYKNKYFLTKNGFLKFFCKYSLKNIIYSSK